MMNNEDVATILTLVKVNWFCGDASVDPMKQIVLSEFDKFVKVVMTMTILAPFQFISLLFQ